MAQIVTISEQTHRPDINEIGDIVEIQDDDVELSKNGYSGFDVSVVEGMTAQEVYAELEGILENE